MAGRILADLSLQLSAENADLKKKLQESENRTKQFDSKMGSITKSLKNQWGQVAIGIGAATAAIGTAKKFVDGLDSVIHSTQGTGDAFNQMLAGGKSAMDSLSRSIATADFDNLIENFKKAYKAGKEYESVLDDIADRTRAVNLHSKETQLEIKKLESKLRNANLPEKERQQVIDEVNRLTQQQIDLETKLADERRQAKRDDLKTKYGISDSDVDLLYEYITQYDKLSLTEQSTLTNAILIRNKMEKFAFGEYDQRYVKLQAQLDEEKKKLNDKQLAYLELGKVINSILDEERDDIVNIEGDYVDALIKLQEFFNKAERAQNNLNTKIEKGEKKANDFWDAYFKNSKTDSDDAISKMLDSMNKALEEDISNLLDESDWELMPGLDKQLDEITAKIKEQIDTTQKLRDSYQSLGQQIGDSLMDGADSWEDYGKNAIDTIRKVLTAQAADIISKALVTAFGGAEALGPFGLMAIPAFVGLALGLANTAINQIPGFANSGIVPGNSFYGDNVLARVNSGEMILDRGKQSNLYKMISGGGSGGSWETANVSIGFDALEIAMVKKARKNKVVYGVQ